MTHDVSDTEVHAGTRSLGFITDVVFAVLVIGLMFLMRVPAKNHLKSITHNASFWVYVIYWCKTVITVVRIVERETLNPVWDERIVSLFFNWGGCMVITLSTVVPCQLYMHYKIKGSFAHVAHTDRLWFCVFVVTVHSVAIMLSCLLFGAWDKAHIDTVLLVWRCYFFICAAVEMYFLLACMLFIRRIASTTATKLKLGGLARHIQITIYMRIGLCSTTALKIGHAIPSDQVGSLHLFFIFTGLLGYHLRSVEMKGFKEVLQAIFTRGAHILLQQDNGASSGQDSTSATTMSPANPNTDSATNRHSAKMVFVLSGTPNHKLTASIQSPSKRESDRNDLRTRPILTTAASAPAISNSFCMGAVSPGSCPGDAAPADLESPMTKLAKVKHANRPKDRFNSGIGDSSPTADTVAETDHASQTSSHSVNMCDSL